MSDEETEVKSFADTIKVSKSSAIKIDVTSEVNDGRISVVSADVADTNELKKLFREDIVSNMKRFREAKEEEEMMKVCVNIENMIFTIFLLLRVLRCLLQDLKRQRRVLWSLTPKILWIRK